MFPGESTPAVGTPTIEASRALERWRAGRPAVEMASDPAVWRSGRLGCSPWGRLAIGAAGGQGGATSRRRVSWTLWRRTVWTAGNLDVSAPGRQDRQVADVPDGQPLGRRAVRAGGHLDGAHAGRSTVWPFRGRSARSLASKTDPFASLVQRRIANEGLQSDFRGWSRIPASGGCASRFRGWVIPVENFGVGRAEFSGLVRRASIARVPSWHSRPRRAMMADAEGREESDRQ